MSVKISQKVYEAVLAIENSKLFAGLPQESRIKWAGRVDVDSAVPVSQQVQDFEKELSDLSGGRLNSISDAEVQDVLDAIM